MFLDEYMHWKVEGLHHPLILQEMFLQATHSGRREVEWMICPGCWHSLLHLEMQADVSAIQSIGSQASREEIQDLYYQVYKLRMLPRSLQCGLEWADTLERNIVSSLKNCLRCKEDELPGVAQATHPTWSRTQQGEMGGTSTEIQLAEARESHQEALATTIILEEEKEWLSQSITRQCPGTCTPSQSQHWQRRRYKGQSRRHHKALPESSLAHTPAMMGGWRGWAWPGDPTRFGAQCGAVLPGAGGWVWGRCRRPFSHISPSEGVWEVGRVEGTNCGYPKLVAGAGAESRCGQCTGTSPKDMGLFWAPPMDEWAAWHWELLPCPTSIPLSLPKWFPLATRSEVPLLGHQGGTMKEDCGLCPGSAMLGWEGQSAYARSTTPFGRVCLGTT